MSQDWMDPRAKCAECDSWVVFHPEVKKTLQKEWISGVSAKCGSNSGHRLSPEAEAIRVEADKLNKGKVLRHSTR